jgi:cystathionine beta-lyase/cystathionine gamma-synthase
MRVLDEVRSAALDALRDRHSDGDLLAASFQDLEDDFEELAHLVRSGRDRLTAARRELDQSRSHLFASTSCLLQQHVRDLRGRCEAALDELVALRSIAAGGQRSSELLRQLTERKHAHLEFVRTHAGLVAAAITATDWQSPSFAHAVRSQAGRLTGRITEHHDDYKRDRHADAATYERAYLHEYVDNPNRLDLRALMTSCGMSAFTTILGYLDMEGALDGPIVVGRSLYHECKQLLRRSRAARRTVWIDEHNVASQLGTVAAHRPSAFFVDSLCNAKGIARPDLATLIPALAESSKRELYLVIDNTGLSCAFQPFALLPRTARCLRLIVFESLTKYAQLGLDRAPAGMIVAEGSDVADAIDGYREHLGTNILDIAAQALPIPDRAIYERRLARLDRNAFLLATTVQKRAEVMGEALFTGARYPGLPDHAAYPYSGETWFRGGFFEIGFAERPEVLEVQRRFVELVLEQARARRVPVAAGASFGLPTTRIYHTASTSTHGEPFVRISPGTEHRLEICSVGDCLGAAMERLAREDEGLPRFPLPG